MVIRFLQSSFLLVILCLKGNPVAGDNVPLKSPSPWLKSREQLYDLLPKGGVVAEIGVAAGANALQILNINKPKKLFLIDGWRYFDHDTNQFLFVGASFAKYSNVIIIRALSKEIGPLFKDNTFDWAYIDAAHDYESVKEDLEIGYAIVKPGGFITGHDYVGKAGVVLAVNEFLREKHLKLAYLTVSNSDSTVRVFESFAIQKPL